MALTDEVDPFGASAAGAWALVPEAKLYDVPLGTALPAGKFGVRIATVEAWVRELTGTVAIRLDGWERLNPVAEDPEELSDRELFAQHARTVVHNGAASYLEAARYPERSSDYAAVLWDRFESGLVDLAAWLERKLAAGAGDVEPDTAGSSGPGFVFPLPLFGDALRF